MYMYDDVLSKSLDAFIGLNQSYNDQKFEGKQLFNQDMALRSPDEMFDKHMSQVLDLFQLSKIFAKDLSMNAQIYKFIPRCDVNSYVTRP